MLKYSYDWLSAQRIQKVFPGCVPCNCWDDPRKIYDIPHYNVTIKYSPTFYGNGDRKVAEIRVECSCCHSSEWFDVESRGVTGYELPW